MNHETPSGRPVDANVPNVRAFGTFAISIHTANTAADNTRHHHKPRKCPSGEEGLKPRREFYIPRCDLYTSQRGFYISRRDLQFVMPDS